MPTVDSVVDSVGETAWERHRLGGSLWLGKKMVGKWLEVPFFCLVFALKKLIVIGWGLVLFCRDGMMDFLRSHHKEVECDVMVRGETTMQTIENRDLF